MAKSLWVRDRGIVTCGRGLVYGETPPACACGEAPGACCTDGVCSQKTFADCLAGGGSFLGGPCLPDTCDGQTPSCCDGVNQCFNPGGAVAVSMTIRFSGTACRNFNGGSGFPFDQTSGNSYTRENQPETCIYGDTIGVAAGTICNNFTINARATFLPNAVTFDSVGNPLIRVSLLIGTLEAATIFVPVSCSGGVFSVQFEDIQDWTGLSVSGSIFVSGGRRCDGMNDGGACCYPDLSCLQLPAGYQSQCVNSGGRWLGIGTSCNPNPCIGETGSCCLPDGRCFENITEERCRVLANYDPTYGFYLGGSCSDCFGACCLPGGSCVNTSRSRCLSRGGTFRRVFPAVPNPCAIPGLCGPPDPPCCLNATCNNCYIPAGVTVPATVSVTLSADYWSLPVGGQCEYRESLGDSQQNGNAALIGDCTFETATAFTQLTRPNAPSLTASVQYKSCGENGRGPHLVVFSSAGGTTLHDVSCNGGNVIINRADFGQPACRQWRNIQIQAFASIPLAGSCGGLAVRPTRIIVPGGGTVSAVTSGCKNCGLGIGSSVRGVFPSKGLTI